MLLGGLGGPLAVVVEAGLGHPRLEGLHGLLAVGDPLLELEEAQLRLLELALEGLALGRGAGGAQARGEPRARAERGKRVRGRGGGGRLSWLRRGLAVGRGFRGSGGAGFRGGFPGGLNRRDRLRRDRGGPVVQVLAVPRRDRRHREGREVCLRIQEVLVAARVERGLAAADLDDLRGELVHEVAVVGDEDERAAVVLEGLEEDLLRVEVEVVGGLVEEEDVRGLQEHLGEGEAVALAAGEDGDLLVDVVPLEEEAAEDRPEHGAHRDGARRGHLLEDGARRVEDGGLVLGEVVEDDLVAEEADALVGPVDAGEDPHQRRLAGPVRAHEGDAVAALDHEVQVAQDDVLAVGLADALQLEDDAPRPRRLGELEADLLPLGRDLDAVDLVEELDPALDLLRLRGRVAEAVDEGLGLLDLLALPAVRLAQPLHPGGVLDEVARVVPVVVGEGLEAHLGDALDRRVEEVAVVGDEDDRAGVVGQVLLEPVARRKVEVVRGLVHQEQVRAGEEQLREGDAHLPAARELLGSALLVGEGEAEALQHLRHPRLDLVPATLLESLGDLGVALEEAVVVAVLGRVGEGVLDAVLLLLQGEQVGEGEDHLLVNRAPVVDDAVLGQVADRGVRRHADLARVGLLDPGEHAQERGLSRPVRPRQADAVPLLDVPGDVLEEDPVAVSLAEALDVDHAGTFRNSRQARCSIARCSGSRKLSRYSLMTLTSMSSHSVQQEAQTEPRTFSLAAGAKGTRWAGGGSPGFWQRTHVRGMGVSVGSSPFSLNPSLYGREA